MPIAWLALSDAGLTERVVRVLQPLGYRVQLVGDSSAAIAWMRATACPTMLVIDLPPPEVELAALVRGLRAVDRGLPVVVIVGDDSNGERRDVVPVADVLYVRPSELELIELVAQTLARYR